LTVLTRVVDDAVLVEAAPRGDMHCTKFDDNGYIII
jgi:hypothetical protein